MAEKIAKILYLSTVREVAHDSEKELNAGVSISNKQPTKNFSTKSHRFKHQGEKKSRFFYFIG
ncbi:hypothetical protein MADA3029_940029 [Vibrio nigripulchritudo MADA3029]|nr:hypothetical protein VIBNIMADA3020_910029 [Vibrio nigripulchritudo MADA3020]CCN52320.1 hypothetical protein VIBNIMADA3021_1230029 [Vibrio nigripulchritudo MADA3021]CCN62146.1 hypothetical protein MADA3029_940029 [Vibrio nigripulchritudo MADA3029]